MAMESTGVFCKPIFNILESRFAVLLVTVRHLEQVPGHKSDVRDCQWIAQLLQCGLLKGSFIPPRSQRELRDLTRHRARLVEGKTRTIDRVQKVLEDANIKLASAASDVMGGLRKAFHSGHKEISEPKHISTRENQNRKRKFGRCFFLSRCHKRRNGKSARVLAVQKCELGIRQCALGDLLEYTRREQEQTFENRHAGCNDIHRDLQSSSHRFSIIMASARTASTVRPNPRRDVVVRVKQSLRS